jgi:ribosomal protein S18 acetylase RimI-like enzyme
MTIEIVPIQRRHIAGFHAVLDGVARERRYLAMLEAPPAAQVRRFVLGNLRHGRTQFVALDDEQVVGWCDVIPKAHVTLQHSGTLGMGVAATHRRLGIGTRLMRATLDAAAANGMTRVELIVRADNTSAITLYRNCGFETEGICRRYLRVDEQWHDALLMARIT